ncbi:MAG: LapA family protein [Deltaproteobacteria bacterium]|nr:LapA family protein [Deltaproteobacteria bacterium]
MRAFARVGLVLLGAGIATAIIFFCLGNKQLVTVDLLKWETEPIPLWVVVVTTFAVGFCLPAFVLIAFAIKTSVKSMKQRRHIRALKAEVNALRNLPLADPERPDVGDELAEAVLREVEDRKNATTEALRTPRSDGDEKGREDKGAGAVTDAGAGADPATRKIAG